MRRCPSPRTPRPPVRVLQRFAPCSHYALLNEVTELVARGFVVRLQRHGASWFDVVGNASLFLVRPDVGDPIASCETVAAAVAAGDRWAEDANRDEDGGDGPRGAA